MSDIMKKITLDDIINQRWMHQVAGNNRERRTSPDSPRKGGACRSVVTKMPANNGGAGCGVKRDRTHGGISRNRSTGGLHKIPDRIREAFLGPSTGGNFGGEDEINKLIVSNLDYGVTDCDILEMFSEFGPLKRASVQYDRYDRSLGSAEVIFERSSDATKVLKECNGISLNGREMKIHVSTPEMPGNNPARTAGFRHSSIRPHSNRSGAKRSTHRGGRGPAEKRSAGFERKSAKGKTTGGKAAGGKLAQKKVLTAEDLDAELDEYMKSVVSDLTSS